jgi:conflict system pore-forming effector with SLATT domain
MGDSNEALGIGDGPSKRPATDAVENLLHSLKYTAASRFNAAKRLENRDKTITFLITLISIYIVSITLMPYFFKFPSDVSAVLNFITVILSVSILVASLLHRSNNDSMNSEQHHRSALETNELRREIMAQKETMSLERFIKFSIQYNSILQKYSVNHDDVDYLKATLERPEEFSGQGKTRRGLLYIRLITSGRLPHIFMVVISAAMIWVIFFYALPARLIGSM